jgi:hypothetical protein
MALAAFSSNDSDVTWPITAWISRSGYAEPMADRAINREDT